MTPLAPRHGEPEHQRENGPQTRARPRSAAFVRFRTWSACAARKFRRRVHVATLDRNLLSSVDEVAAIACKSPVRFGPLTPRPLHFERITLTKRRRPLPRADEPDDIADIRLAPQGLPFA